MNTGRKISYIYSAAAIVLVVAACGVFLLLSNRYTERLYYDLMEEKARVSAMERYGQDDLAPSRYERAVQCRRDAIPTSAEVFVPTTSDSADEVLLRYLEPDELRALRHGNVVRFRNGDEVGTALLYDDNSGTYASLVLSRNPYGDQIASTIGKALAVLVALSALLLWLISRLWAGRMVNRIDRAYQAEKLFVSNARHELNNPLTVIRGQCEVALLTEHSPERYRHTLQTIGCEADRISDIMNQLLVLSDARGLRAEETRRIDMGNFLERYSNMQTNVTVKNNYHVTANGDMLDTALSNIIHNAHKYGTNVRINLDRRHLTISNSGRPIPVADIPHIFDPFYRGSNAVGTEGSGIGLALSHSILSRYGCRIEAASTSDATVFTVTFPRGNMF